MDKFILIGTAGRDKTKPMTLALWKWMLKDAYSRVTKGAEVISGGAAWADHLAVSMFLFGHASGITLHLPAPFSLTADQFEGDGWKSAGQIANHYHRLFSQAIDRNTLLQIGNVIRKYWEEPNSPVTIDYEPASSSSRGMFARNAKVAAHHDAHMLAYTFGPGDQPADGGTLDTWNKFQGQKTHISLPHLY